MSNLPTAGQWQCLKKITGHPPELSQSNSLFYSLFKTGFTCMSQNWPLLVRLSNQNCTSSSSLCHAHHTSYSSHFPLLN